MLQGGREGPRGGHFIYSCHSFSFTAFICVSFSLIHPKKYFRLLTTVDKALVHWLQINFFLHCYARRIDDNCVGGLVCRPNLGSEKKKIYILGDDYLCVPLIVSYRFTPHV